MRAVGKRRGRRAGVAAVMAGLVGLAAGALAQEIDIASVVGRPVLALAQRPELTAGLRLAGGGHRGALAARLRDDGPPVEAIDGRYYFGWGCLPEGCREGGAFLAWDSLDERMYLLLTEAGRVRLSVPPNPRSWPNLLREPVMGFVPALGEAMGEQP